MSNKSASTESSRPNDEQRNEGPAALFQQESNARLTDLDSLSNKTLQDLPVELLVKVLIKVIAMEVSDMKLSKNVWKEKADLVISRLGTVCLQWSSILTTNFFLIEVHRALDRTAPETIHLEILQQYPIAFHVFKVTTLNDEMYMICREQNIVVYNSNNMAEGKYVVVPQSTFAVDIAACNASNCVYVLGLSAECFSVLRITKDEDHQFSISPWLNGLSLPFSTISVSANGGLIILSGSEGQNPAGVSVYDPNGNLLHKMILWPGILGFRCRENIIQKPNGNLVLVTLNSESDTELMEINATGSIEHQCRSSLRVQSGVHFADISGRFVFTEQDNRIRLLDSELNLLDFTFPHLNGSLLNFSSERNEIVSILSVGNNHSVLTIFRFTEDVL